MDDRWGQHRQFFTNGVYNYNENLWVVYFLFLLTIIIYIKQFNRILYIFIILKVIQEFSIFKNKYERYKLNG